MEGISNLLINPFKEVVSYETLWAIDGMTESKITELFANNSGMPSEILKSMHGLVPDENLLSLQTNVSSFIKTKLSKYNVSINGDFQFPVSLRKAKHPIELFYYKGNLDILSSSSVSIVGARDASEEGLKRARNLSRELSKAGFTIVSGLARGVDTEAHKAAIQVNGNTIAVIGTPIDEYYPKENKELQDQIAEKFLLISQVPFYRYKNEPFIAHKNYFPRRNSTMAAISDATIIVEASDTSGSLTQARACLFQKKKLFILDSCFKNPKISWPKYYEERGAIRVKNLEDILSVVQPTKNE